MEGTVYRKRDLLFIAVMLDIGYDALLAALVELEPEERERLYLGLLLEAGRS